MAGSWKKLAAWFDGNGSRVVVATLTDPMAEVSVIQTDETYVRLWLSDYSFAREDHGVHGQVPMVQAQVALNVSGERVTLTRFAQGAEGARGAGTDRGRPLTPLLPYRGEVIEVTAGLSAMKGPSSIRTAIDALDLLSAPAGAPFHLASVMAQAASEGIDRLSEAAEAEVVLGLRQSLLPPTAGGDMVLRPGYVVIVRTDRQDLKSRLTMEGSRVHELVPGGSRPLKGYDFIAIRVEARDDRPDWTVGELGELVTGTVRAIKLNRQEEARELETKAFSLCLTTPELVDADRVRVIGRLQDHLQLARASAGRRRAAPVAPVTLDQLMLGAIPRELAKLRRVPTLGELASFALPAESSRSPDVSPVPPPGLFWNSRFPDDPASFTEGTVVVGRVYRLETAIEAAADPSARSTPLKPTKVVGFDISFELRGTGVSFRPTGTEEPFSDAVDSAPLPCTPAGTRPFSVDCLVERAGDVKIELNLIVRNLRVAAQALGLQAVAPGGQSPPSEAAKATQATPTGPQRNIDLDTMSRIRTVQLRLEVEEDDEHYTLRLNSSVGGKSGPVRAATQVPAVGGAASKARGDLIGLSRSYHRVHGGGEFQIDDAGQMLVRFAQAGFDLHREIFGLPGVGDDERTRMAVAIARSGRREGERNQLQVDAALTGIPWSILYDSRALAFAATADGTPVDPRHQNRPETPDDVDLSCFWGYRFDLFHAYDTDDFPAETLGGPTVQAQAVLNGALEPASSHQRALLADTAAGGQPDMLRFSPVLEDSKGFLEWVRAGDTEACDLLYLFCHAWSPAAYDANGLPARPDSARDAYFGLDQAAEGAAAGRVTLRQLEDAWPRERDRRPLVFLHACGSGQDDAMYGHPFVDHFLGTWEARGIVGTQWTVPTEFADAFSRELLRAFRRPGTAIIDALRQASEVAYDQGNVFPLIYALYGRNDLCIGKD